VVDDVGGDVTRITVSGETSYDVLVGRDLIDYVARLMPDTTQRVMVVRPDAVADAGTRVRAALVAHGLEATEVSIADGEAAKNLTTAADLWGELGRAGFTRSDAIVAVGGGATTDAVGFVAATWLRGVPVVHVPTTLLGMVDAAIGGKTALDTADGKNLVGAFHSPAGVLCDLDLLATLPPADLSAGMAEVVKAGFLADPAILDVVEADPAAALDPAGPQLRDLVERAVRFKAEVVGADLRERGGREVLNYGHTLAHAIEKVEGFTWRHGDAVSVGLVFAAALSGAAGRLDAATVTRHHAVLGSLGLPTTYARDAWPSLRAAMSIDKKARGDMLRFVVLDGLARPGLLEGPDEALLESVYAEVAG
jgi:3-dehydroquinate synthase